MKHKNLVSPIAFQDEHDEADASTQPAASSVSKLPCTTISCVGIPICIVRWPFTGISLILVHRFARQMPFITLQTF
jgi:hypothetical protein